MSVRGANGRGAEYERRILDYYPTPKAATRVILDHVKFADRLCDPCCGSTMRMMRVFREYGYQPCGSDMIYGFNFLADDFPWAGADICSNPPYGGKSGKKAMAFVHRALRVSQRKVAMLLPVDFDSAGTRRSLFADNRHFALKIILTNRIRWFNDQAGSTNHAWYVWDKKNIWYRPKLIYAKQDHVNASGI